MARTALKWPAPSAAVFGVREPPAELHCRPVVIRASEGDEHRPLRRPFPSDEQRNVAGRLREHGRKVLVGSSLGQERVRRGGEQEIDVELGGEPSQLLTWRRGGERGRPGYDTACFECRPALFEPS